MAEETKPQATETKPLLVGELSPEQVVELKKKHPGLYQLIADGHTAYYRQPNRSERRAAMSFLTQGDILGYSESLMADTKVSGSDELLNDDTLFSKVFRQVQEAVDPGVGKLVKI